MAKRLLLLSFLLGFTSLQAQLLKGTIADVAGEPIPFARISVQNTSYGTVANAQGHFQLELKNGDYVILYSAMDFNTVTESVVISDTITFVTITLTEQATELEEAVITARSKKDLGKEIMKQVIDKRSYFRDQLNEYNCTTYCFTSLEKEMTDSIKTDSIISREKMNISEWYGRSYFKANNRYKDVIDGYIDLVDPAQNPTGTVSFVVDYGDNLEPNTSVATNPYLFVNGLKDADINLFDNLIQAPGLAARPLTSPMAYNAFLYYNFFVESSFYENAQKIYEIRVEPRFKEEALFQGSLFIRDTSWELVSYALHINKGALTYFKDMYIIADYEKMGTRIVPKRREFVYLIREGKRKIHGAARIMHSTYKFEPTPAKNGKFWLETTVYTPEAFNRERTFWDSIRPFHLKQEETDFIAQQDSVARYHASEEYLRQQDSIMNTLTIWDFLFNGVGFRNTFKKQEIYFSSLMEQVVPFGVGGYRHRFSVDYTKGFKNNHELEVHPTIDYGFHNKDLKGQLGVGYMYNPRRFAKFFVEAGDIYDFVTGYQSIQGTFAPANRVRNRKFEIYHRLELINGLYFKAGVFYSNRQSIDNVEYPSWVDNFGFFSQPTPFEGYKIFMTDLEFSYHFRQKYQLRGNQKIIIGSQWPVLSMQYKKGLPNIFGGQSNFDYLELRLTDEINLNGLGNSEIKFVAGSFIRKQDLRLIEHKYFRTSDKFFFSNPINSQQLLDTALNTSNTFIQFNGIHHFNGFFLNKIWGLNKLKLEETIGGSFLTIPDAKFVQAELYAGLERVIRIRKQRFKLGVYAVTAASTFTKADVQIKFGINFYDSFHGKWDY